MSAIEHPSRFAYPSLRPSPRRGTRLEALAIVVGICLPVPVLAATGLSVPLPNVVERIAAGLVPWADAAVLEAGELPKAVNGSIVPAAADATPAAVTTSASDAVTRPPEKRFAHAADPPKPIARPVLRPARTDSFATAAPAPTPTPGPSRSDDAAPLPAVEAPPASPVVSQKPAPTTSPPANSGDGAKPVREPAPAPPAAAGPTPTETLTNPPKETPKETNPVPAPLATAPVVETIVDTVEDVEEALSAPIETVEGVAADPVGTVGGIVADPVGGVGGLLGGALPKLGG